MVTATLCGTSGTRDSTEASSRCHSTPVSAWGSVLPDCVGSFDPQPTRATRMTREATQMTMKPDRPSRRAGTPSSIVRTSPAPRGPTNRGEYRANDLAGARATNDGRMVRPEGAEPCATGLDQTRGERGSHA